MGWYMTKEIIAQYMVDFTSLKLCQKNSRDKDNLNHDRDEITQ